MNELNRNYINGQWVSWAGDMIDVHEAGTGDVIARVPAAGADEMEQAIAAADAAFEAGRKAPWKNGSRCWNSCTRA